MFEATDNGVLWVGPSMIIGRLKKDLREIVE